MPDFALIDTLDTPPLRVARASVKVRIGENRRKTNDPFELLLPLRFEEGNTLAILQYTRPRNRQRQRARDLARRERTSPNTEAECVCERIVNELLRVNMLRLKFESSSTQQAQVSDRLSKVSLFFYFLFK